MIRAAAAVAVAILLAGCGQKGPLKLPEAPKQPSAAPASAPATTPAPAPSPEPAPAQPSGSKSP